MLSRARASARRTLANRALIFPAGATFLGFVLSCLGWSGNSSGVLRAAIEGTGPGSSVVFGTPRAIRSDEWLVQTPLLISQAENGFRRHNGTIGTGGADISLPFNVPYVDWNTLFRPETWPVLGLPLEQGFAAYWWMLSLILLLGAYSLVLSILPGRPVLAAGIATALLFSPFVQWWYHPGTLLSLGWACWLITAAIQVSRARTRTGVIAACVGVTYFTTALGMIAYVPYVLPCVLVAVAGSIGWLTRVDEQATWRSRLPRLGATAAAGLVGGAFLGLFILTRSGLVSRIGDTAYPGVRRIPTGGAHESVLFSGAFDYVLQRDTVDLTGWAVNTSEGSSFVLVGLVLIVPALGLLIRSAVREHRIDGLLAAMVAVQGLFLTVMFVPGLDLLARATGLSLVPHERLMIGVGLASFLILPALVRETSRQQVPRPAIPAVLVGALAAVVFGATLLRLREIAPQAMGSTKLLVVGLIAVIGLGGVSALFLIRPAIAAVGLAVFGLAICGAVNPIYDGVYDIRDTALGQTIKDIDEQDPGNWVNVGPIYNTAVLAESDVVHLSGVYGYPDERLWSWLDPTGAQVGVWNRYAYVLFVSDDTIPTTISSPSPDVVTVSFDPCAPVMQEHVQYALSNAPMASSCVALERTVMQGAMEYYIYRLD